MKFSTPQLEAIQTRNTNVIVSASAGSGKTSVLVERLCQLVLKDHISIDSILAMTFTQDAANEMKTRLRLRLQEEKEDPYIRQQLALLETASICTIDSFCLSIVQTYYYLLNIPYTMSHTVASEAIIQQAFQEAYTKAMTTMDPKLFSKLHNYFISMTGSCDLLQKSVQNFLNIANAKANGTSWIQDCIHNSKQPLQEEISHWFFLYFQEHIQAMIEIVKIMLNYTLDDDFRSKQEMLETCLKALQEKNYIQFRHAFRIYFLNTPLFKKKYDGEDYGEIQKEYKDHEAKIAAYLFDDDIYRQDQKEQAILIEAFCTLCLEVQKTFSMIKRQMEVIDFQDMEHFAYQLLQNEMVSQEVRSRFDMILVDEFQDTNELQESIIASFARENNVFRVGDIKQSIYGFRQANPNIMRNHMAKNDENNKTLILYENYRSNANIIAFNNDFYEKIMNAPLLDSQFSKEDIAQIGTDQQSSCPQYPIRFLYTEYLPWLETHPDVSKIQAKKLHKENQIDLIANDILAKHKEGTPYKDICILTRSHGPQEDIKKGLEAYNIPVLAEIDHGFYTNHAIQIIIQTLNAIQDPYNDIALTASLCSPIGQMTTDQLAKACIHKEKNTPLYQQIKEDPALQSWKELANRPYESISHLIRMIYAHNDFYFSHTTKQDKTNLDSFLDISTQYEDPTDLRGFLSQIQKSYQVDAISEAYPFGKNDDVVKIKTMHHSKGLQFPIVYIYSKHETKDMTASDPILLDPHFGVAFLSLVNNKVKRMSKSYLALKTKQSHMDLEEEMRVFYVATTRPKQELIIVDSISQLDDYAYPFSIRAVMQKRSYTSWLLHTYYEKKDPNFIFDKKNELYERPKTTATFSQKIAYSQYTKEPIVIESQTASNQKKILSWPSFTCTKQEGAKRGTLFHEIVAQCSYPYQKEEIEQKATQYRISLSNKDLEQLFALNANPTYQQYMKASHQFEASYIVKINQKIVHGFIDLIVFYEDHIVILDFKTDHVSKEETLIQQYQEQLQTYRQAIQILYPNHTIETKIYSFSLKTMICIPNV